MPRIEALTTETAGAQSAEILHAVNKKMGMTPNLIATMAQSPAVANAYLGFSQALGDGALSARLREQIALAVGEANSCGYCVSAHTLLGKGAGLSEEGVIQARQGAAADDREHAALRFAVKAIEARGHVEDGDVAQLRDAGFDDGEIAEIIANIALNLFTNYFNHIAGTEIDFPVAPELAAV